MARVWMDSTLLWLGLACSVYYVLEPSWRLWRNRPGKWGPLHAELFAAPLFILLMLINHGAPAIRVLIVLFFSAGTVVRLIARRRFNVPAWP